jgi:hypothetical protein
MSSKIYVDACTDLATLSAFGGFRNRFEPVCDIVFFVAFETPTLAADKMRGATWRGRGCRGVEDHETPFGG